MSLIEEDLTEDELNDELDAATPKVRFVRLCLDGQIQGEYEELAAQIAERRTAYEESAKVAAAVAALDDRLASKAPAVADYVDPEQPRLDALLEQMKAKTRRFVLRPIPSGDWTSFVEQFPPRQDPATGRPVMADIRQNVDVTRFYPALVRASLGYAESTFAKLRSKLSIAQFQKLQEAAEAVNMVEEDLPF